MIAFRRALVCGLCDHHVWEGQPLRHGWAARGCENSDRDGAWERRLVPTTVEMSSEGVFVSHFTDSNRIMYWREAPEWA